MLTTSVLLSVTFILLFIYVQFRLNHDQTLRQLIHEPEFQKTYSHLLKDIEDKDFYELECKIMNFLHIIV